MKNSLKSSPSRKTQCTLQGVRYLYRVLRKEESSLALLRDPDCTTLSRLSAREMRTKIIKHVGFGNDRPWDEGVFISTTTSETKAVLLSKEQGRAELYGSPPVILRFDMDYIEQFTIIPLRNEREFAKYFHEEPDRLT